MWVVLCIGGLGIGGIVVPASIITTIICPDVCPPQSPETPFPSLTLIFQDLIATIAALTLSIRVVGGSIGYTIYYNIFVSKFEENAVHYIGGVMLTKLGIKDPHLIEQAILATSTSLIEQIRLIPGLESEAAYQAVVRAGQIAFAESYKYVYFVSIAFGVLSIISAMFLGDIKKYMTDHVAVVVH